MVGSWLRVRPRRWPIIQLVGLANSPTLELIVCAATGCTYQATKLASARPAWDEVLRHGQDSEAGWHANIRWPGW